MDNLENAAPAAGDENIFPEEGFPIGGEEPEKQPAPAEEILDEDTPWLNFIEKYPQYMNEPLPEGMEEAVAAGESPTEAYLRLENERLAERLRLLRLEELLRKSSAGSARSTRAESPEDDFAAGLRYEG